MNFYLSTLAYLDPGTGSMLLQAIVGGSAGLFVFDSIHKNLESFHKTHFADIRK